MADPLHAVGLDPLTASFIRYNAARDLALYARTRERYLVLRVFKAHRQATLPVPEVVLAIIDEWAAEPVSKQSAKAIANAERNLDVVNQLHIREHELEPEQAANAAARSVAIDMGLTFENVKVIKAREKARAAAQWIQKAGR